MDAGVTFRTEFLAIHPDEAQAMVNYYAKWQHDGCPTVWQTDASATNPNPSPSVIPKTLLGLTKRIQSVIQAKFSAMGAFVKLSTRSPKDSPIALANAKRQFLQQLREAAATSSGSVSLNSRKYLLSNAVKDSLHVYSGHEAMLHHLHSERVFEDLSDALKRYAAAVKSRTDHASPSPDAPPSPDASPVFEIELVVREYLRISLENEFRAFVWDGACIN